MEIKNGKELNKSGCNRMSRLIDADKLIEDVLNSMPTGSARGVFRAFIDEQPTVYDIDKVIEKLGEKSITFETDFTVNEHRWILTNDAIEIVKAGRLDD